MQSSLVHPVRIGPHTLPNNLALAPMAGVTDRPFRRLCRRWGAGLVVSEMIATQAMLAGNGKALAKADHAGEQRPVAVQIAGSEPEQLAEAARLNEGRGADIIDINMGCPAKKICKADAGSALMRDEALVEAILRAVVAAVDVPVTLKMRTGWDSQNKNAPGIARLAEDAGIAALAVHGRTRADGYSGQAEYETLAQVKAAVDLPVYGNGDVREPQDAERLLRESGCDGVMIGRGAQGKPWIFQQVAEYLSTGEVPPDPDVATRRDLVLEHLQALRDFYGDYRASRIARKHLGWFSKGMPQGASFRERINRADSVDEQREAVLRFFDQQQDAA